MNENVRGFEIAVNNASLVRVVNGGTHLTEEPQSLARVQSLLITELRDGEAFHVFHHKVGPP